MFFRPVLTLHCSSPSSIRNAFPSLQLRCLFSSTKIMAPKSQSQSKTSATSSPHKSKASSAGPRVIYWFRTDLRLHDSPALTQALSLQPSVFIPLWTWDPHYVYRARVGANRWNFLLECQGDVSASLTRLNPRQKLHVVREAPLTVLPKLFRKWRITHLVFESDTDAYARERDDEVKRLAEAAGVEVVAVLGRTLYDPDELVKRNGGKPTMSMAQVRAAAAKIPPSGEPARPVEEPTSLPDPATEEEMDLSDLQHDMPTEAEEGDLNEGVRDNGKANDRQYVAIMGPNKDYAVPTLAELGISASQVTTPHRGGESEALKLLAKHIANESYIGTFAKPETAPTAFAPASTTLLSPHLHFGSLSVRKFWWDVEAVLAKRRKSKQRTSEIPVNLPGQLLFREMYFGAQAALGHAFSRAEGNSIAKFIDWHLLSSSSSSIGYTIDDPQAEKWFQRWASGTTGFPFVDALMRQLRLEGFIHHLGRHMVCSFLTRGGCYVSWERGAEVFEELLLDHETACNAGNWMWVSCTAFYSQFVRVYSPIAFGRKWDPDGIFVRKYVPELARFDKKYIYEPWKAPIADQKAWRCLVKGDSGGSGDVVQKEGEKSTEKDKSSLRIYPKPMFDFDERRRICIDKIKHAYGVGLHGADQKVLTGEWKEMLGYEIQQEEEEGEEEQENRGKRQKKMQKDTDDDDNNGKNNHSLAERGKRKRNEVEVDQDIINDDDGDAAAVATDTDDGDEEEEEGKATTRSTTTATKSVGTGKKSSSSSSTKSKVTTTPANGKKKKTKTQTSLDAHLDRKKKTKT